MDCTSVACLEAVGRFGEDLRRAGTAVELIGKDRGLIAALWRFLSHVRQLRPQVVHCHNLPAFFYGALAARLAGDIPVVMTKHGTLIKGTGLAGRISHFLIRRCDVVVVSPELVDIMRAWIGNPCRPARYIANGISLSAYEQLPTRAQARAQLALPEHAFIVGIVARLMPGKRHLALVDIFARILQKLPRALLLMVGDGPMGTAVETRIRELGLGESVLRMGERQDVPRILAALDVFCLASETEGMPMTVLEAMAARLPVVATNAGGIPELVEPGHNGLLVPVQEPQELEGALLKLGGDPDLARNMGQRGYERLLREFSLEQTLRAYEEIYRQAIERRNTP